MVFSVSTNEVTLLQGLTIPIAPSPPNRDPPTSSHLTREELEGLEHPPLLRKVHHEVTHVVTDLGFE